MEKIFVSLPYIYPICPLSIDHGRMFVIADILARQARTRGVEVIFPVASHYSGNTAHAIAGYFQKDSPSGASTEERERKQLLYRDFYGTPTNILKKFSEPVFILDYFSQEILWELKSLNVSCDYDNYYTTKNQKFSEFVREVILRYKKEGLVVENRDGEIALDYDDELWKEKTRKLLGKTEFIHPSQAKTIESALKNDNVRNDWKILRANGFGVKYEDKVVDPMFDSELFTVFDLYMAYRAEPELKEFDNDAIFAGIFDHLSEKNTSNDNKLIERIVQSLPCNVFVCEEHLKNWVLKRMYAESLFMNESYQTKGYFVTGMGLLNGKRMSASRGQAILVKDLIRDYGPIKARLIMLLTGGHPSKVYQFDERIPGQANDMIENLISYIILLLATPKESMNPANENSEMSKMSAKIDSFIEKGYFKQALVELITILPKKNPLPNESDSVALLNLYEKYLEILLPGLMKTFSI